MLDETTYYFSIFALDQNNTMIDVQTNSITAEFRRPSWRLDQATQSGSFDIGNTGNYGLRVSDDGQYLYIGHSGSQTIKQYRLTTPFDITSANYVTSISTGISGQHGVYISPDGLKLYGIGHDNSTIKEFLLQSPNNLTGATGSNVTLPVNGGTGICFSDDGMSFFISNYSNMCIYKISTGTPFKLSGNTLTTQQTKSVGFSPRGTSMSNDGLHMFMGYNRNMVQRNLTTKNDISTASSVYSKSTPATNDDNYCGTITKDGKYFYYIYNSRYVVRLSMPKI